LQKQIQFSNRWGETLAGTFHVPTEDCRRGIILGHCFTCSRHTKILRDLSLALVEEGFKIGESIGHRAWSKARREVGRDERDGTRGRKTDNLTLAP
jgi:hypothetical protein